MKRILSTSALTILMASGVAYAQDSEASGEVFATVPSDPSMLLASDYIGQTVYSSLGGEMSMEESSTSGSTEATTETGSSETGSTETEMAAEGEGETTAQSQPENVGEISDIIMSQDGQVEYVILGVGGFLGIGEQNVAVNFDALTVQPDPQNPDTMMIMISATQEEIENAPEFDRSTVVGVEGGESTEMQSSESGTMSGDADTEMENEVEDAANDTEQAAEEAANETEQAAEEAAAETEQAAENAAAETEEAAEDAAQATENAAEEAASETGEAVEETGDAVENATDEATSSN